MRTLAIKNYDIATSTSQVEILDKLENTAQETSLQDISGKIGETDDEAGSASTGTVMGKLNKVLEGGTGIKKLAYAYIVTSEEANTYTMSISGKGKLYNALTRFQLNDTATIQIDITVDGVKLLSRKYGTAGTCYGTIGIYNPKELPTFPCSDRPLTANYYKNGMDGQYTNGYSLVYFVDNFSGLKLLEFSSDTVDRTSTTTGTTARTEVVLLENYIPFSESIEYVITTESSAYKTFNSFMYYTLDE